MSVSIYVLFFFFFFQAEDGIRDYKVTGVQTCALPISRDQGEVPELHHARAEVEHRVAHGIARGERLVIIDDYFQACGRRRGRECGRQGGIQHIGLQARRRGLRPGHLGSFPARTGERQQGDQNGASHASPPMVGWSERQEGQDGCRLTAKRRRGPVVAEGPHLGEGAGPLIDTLDGTPSPKSTTFCFHPVANAPPPPPTPGPPTPPQTTLAPRAGGSCGPT